MHTALLLSAVWSLLLAMPLLVPWLGRSVAVLAVYAAALALLLATRPPRPRSARLAGPGRPAVLGLALTAGYASFPAWVAAAVGAGLLVGLAPRGPAPPGAGGPALWAAALVLAPAFEELLYRERLLEALKPRTGAVGAVVLTSALFALPHLEPWHLVGTFLTGLGLGATMLLGRSVGICIAVHAGLNLASLVGGSPPARLALAPLAAALTGMALLGAALLLHRGVPTAVSPRGQEFPGG